MRSQKIFGQLMLAVIVVGLFAAPSFAVPREPVALPQVGVTFPSPYDRVWDAVVRSLGVVNLMVADKASGRIETEPFVFAFPTSSGQGLSTQVLWITMTITVRPDGNTQATVLVDPRVHDALFLGFTPGPTNNPWADLFGKVADRLHATP